VLPTVTRAITTSQVNTSLHGPLPCIVLVQHENFSNT